MSIYIYSITVSNETIPIVPLSVGNYILLEDIFFITVLSLRKLRLRPYVYIETLYTARNKWIKKGDTIYWGGVYPGT